MKAIDSREAGDRMVRLLRRVAISGALCLIGAGASLADDLEVPAHILDPSRPVAAIYQLNPPATGAARLEIEWSDTENRIVERRVIATVLTRAQDMKFTLDARRAVTIRNTLHVRFSLDGTGSGGKKEHRKSDGRATFTVAPSGQSWSDYQIIMWHERTADQLPALRRLGISAGKVNGNRIEMANLYMTKQAEPLLESNLPWYVENIATDFYSAYHRWFPDHPENWRFLEAKQRYREDLTSTAAFVRDPSLSDPAWLEKVRDRLTATVRLHRPYRPLFYNLGDEPGVQDLASFWDFDFSEPSLQQLRLWLMQRYPSLQELNREWGTQFERWDAVMPMTTREAMQRPDDNYAAWADFKEWMDVAFARALRMGTDTVHAADPEAVAAIEGAQIPGWGGYNYAHLAHAVDLMEIYDFAGNLDIVRSLNPKMIFVTTSGGGGAREEHQIWRELLRGSRGLILWDDKSDLVRADGSLGNWGQSIGPLFHELRGGVGALLINSVRSTDPVAVLHSPASMRTQWMLDQKPKGDAWIDRNADAEYQDNVIRASTRHFTDGLDKLGLQYRFITSSLIEQGALQRDRYKILVLPHAIALSHEEAAAIRRFVEEGGIVIADSEPGIFDQHSRRLATPLLADLFPAGGAPSPSSVPLGKGMAIYLVPPIPTAPAGGKGCVESAALQPLAQVLKAAGLSSHLDVVTPKGEPATAVQTYVFRNGDVTIIALQRDTCVSPSTPGSTAPDGREPLQLNLQRSGYLYDVRARKFLGHRSRIEFELDRTAPTILAFSPRPLAPPSLRYPQRMRLGESVMLRVQVAGSAGNARRVLHVDVVDPSGKSIDYYSGNIVATGGTATKRLALALNDPVGKWQIRVTDILSGTARTFGLQVSK